LTGRPTPLPNEKLLQLLIFTALLVVSGPLCVFLSAYLLRRCRERQEPRIWLLCVISGALGGFLLIALAPAIGNLSGQVLQGVIAMLGDREQGRDFSVIGAPLLLLWSINLLLAPLLTLFFELGRQLDEIINGKPIAALLDDEQRAQLLREQSASIQADQYSRNPSPFSKGQLGLGSYVVGKTDLFPQHIGVLKQQHWLGLTEQVLDQHLFILGAPGAGKSEAIKRIIAEVLANTERDVIFVDGKGEQPLALAIRALTHHHQRGAAPIFRMGFEGPGMRYNGFSGQKEAIYSRLVALAGVTKLEGNADIYGRITREVLQLICYAPQGPPRSIGELRRRLTAKWLKDTYQNDPLEGEIVKDKDFPQRLEGVQLRLRPLLREFTPFIGPDGFTIEDSRAAIFCIRTQSMSDTSSQFLLALIEDILDYIGKRQKRPAVLVIDEFGMFGNDNIIKLLSLARSSKLGIVLATQDVANLGDETTMRLILANTGTKLLMRSDFPEDIAKLAGTIYQLEGSVQYERGQATGLGSVRPQHTFKIDMNEAAQLQTGEAFLIRHRQAAKLKIAALDEEEVEKLIQATPPEVIPPMQPGEKSTGTEQPALEPTQRTSGKRTKKPKNID
jgi:hypothetical protein